MSGNKPLRPISGNGKTIFDAYARIYYFCSLASSFEPLGKLIPNTANNSTLLLKRIIHYQVIHRNLILYSGWKAFLIQ
jgi:hypothetical protein